MTGPRIVSPGQMRPGFEAARVKGWWPAHKWLLIRRTVQLGLLALFLAGPLFGVWIVKGTLASSLTLGVLPLTDPMMALQSFAAGHIPETTALTGAAILVAVYAVIGGRLFCAWVCPVNLVTDAANWLRDRLGLEKGWQPPRSLRLWLLGAVIAASAVTGTIAWEWINPVTVLHRGLVFGTLLAGFGWLVIASIFLFDLALSKHGWCGHLCPVGAFYGQLGRFGLLRVSAKRREVCNDCMDCFRACPEPHAITPALMGGSHGDGPIILSPDCSNCGRCIDVCAKNVFTFVPRTDRRVEPKAPENGGTDLKEVA